MLNFRLTAPPAAEPVTLALAKQHCRIDITDDDTLVTAYIAAAREWCEEFLKRAIFNQSYLLTLDSFPYGDFRSTRPLDQRDPWSWGSYWNDMAIRLPRPVCVSVDQITYLDPTGQQQTLVPALYSLDLNSEPARIVPAPGLTWPTGQVYQPGSIQVRYTAGSYGDGLLVNTCPQRIVMAILLIVAHWYRNREAVSDAALASVPMAVEALLRPLVFETFGNFGSGY